ncbi:MAG: VOC family protein [Deltaproteobacteria bacterium]|nr:VOC family protein [Deltaproteobacteria bacterium]
MSQGVGVVGVLVHDQDEALSFYVNRVGFVVHTDVRNGPFRWLTIQHPAQPDLQLGLVAPGPPLHDAETAQALRALVAKGAMPGLVMHVDDCAATCARLVAAGVELNQEPIARFGNVDAGFRDPSGNGWKIIQRGR